MKLKQMRNNLTSKHLQKRNIIFKLYNEIFSQAFFSSRILPLKNLLIFNKIFFD